MKTVRLGGPREISIADLEEPTPHGNHVVVKVMASTICGTERHAYEHGLAARETAAGVLNVGHEATGIVWKSCAGSRLREGARVVLFASRRHCGRCQQCARGRWVLCQGEEPQLGFGYHSQFELLREDFCLPLSDDIDFVTGALLSDVLGTAYRAIRRLGVCGSDTVLVSGQGPIGLAATMISRFFGASVLAVDTNGLRRELALRCGATAAFDPTEAGIESKVQSLCGPQGVSVAIDCVGSQASRLACLRSVAPGGRVAVVGLSEGLELDQATFLEHVFKKDLELIASWYSNPSDIYDLEDLVRRGLAPLAMVTHEFALEEAAAAFSLMFGGQSGKVVLKPW